MPHINIHQLKAGGKSLEMVLYRQYGAEGLCYISKLPPTEETVALGDYPSKLQALQPVELSRIGMLTGHMFFGIHACFSEPSRYISMLRKPSERLVSYYFYLLDSPDLAVGRMLRETKMSLEEFVLLGPDDFDRLDLPGHAREQLSFMLENGQSKFISGLNPPLGASTRELYETALANMKDHFACVGLTERFDESLVLFKQKLDWRIPLFYTRANVTREHPARTRLSAGVLAVIRERNRFDVKLYKRVRRMFEREVAGQRRFIRIELAKLSRNNLLFGGYLRLRRLIKR